MNSQSGNSFYSYSHMESPLRPISRNTPHRANQSGLSNTITPSSTRDLRIIELDLDTKTRANAENLKKFAIKSEEISGKLEDLSLNIERAETQCLDRIKEYSTQMTSWNADNDQLLETNFQKQKEHLSDFFEKFHSVLDKENAQLSDDFENRIRILVNEFQEKRYQRNLRKRKREAEVEELKIRIFGRLEEAQALLEQVARKRRQGQEKALQSVSDLAHLFERRIVQSERDRDENEVILAQMLDSIISKFE